MVLIKYSVDRVTDSGYEFGRITGFYDDKSKRFLIRITDEAGKDEEINFGHANSERELFEEQPILKSAVTQKTTIPCAGKIKKFSTLLEYLPAENGNSGTNGKLKKGLQDLAS